MVGTFFLSAFFIKSLYSNTILIFAFINDTVMPELELAMEHRKEKRSKMFHLVLLFLKAEEEPD